ncbi:hypothetical protein MFLAVUS_007575 [Mucor flavus]|uniref:Uncharacterized protein n=1 Tax=Mucor flavus TaxID=439312 RepID=A0ABP9Z4P5_9FUNG
MTTSATQTKKTLPIINMIRGKKTITPIVTSVPRYNDPYMPHISQHSHSTPCLSKSPIRHKANSSMPRLTIKPQQVHHHHHHYYLNTPTCPNSPIPSDQPFYTHSSSYSTFPSLSPPPLSPNMSRPSWRNSKRSSTWQPAPSISSSEEEDDDDNTPIGLQLIKSDSLLSDYNEDGDDELIPIAGLSLNIPYMSAAEKYKAKVKARLF